MNEDADRSETEWLRNDDPTPGECNRNAGPPGIVAGLSRNVAIGVRVFRANRYTALRPSPGAPTSTRFFRIATDKPNEDPRFRPRYLRRTFPVEVFRR